jgi:hypothetical protein
MRLFGSDDSERGVVQDDAVVGGSETCDGLADAAHVGDAEVATPPLPPAAPLPAEIGPCEAASSSAGPPIAAVGGDAPPPVARHGKALATVVLPNGAISVYANNNFQATCSNAAAGHGGRCRLTRRRLGHPTRKHAPQGRPLGLMAAWLENTAAATTQAIHCEPFLVACTPFELRRAARGRASLLLGWAALAGYERAQGDGELSEPEICP